MNLYSLNVKNINRSPLISSHHLHSQRTFLAEKPKTGFLHHEVFGKFSEIGFSNSASVYRPLVVRSMGKKNQGNSSSSGSSDQSIPEGDGSKGSTPPEIKKSSESNTNKPHRVNPDWRTVRANLIAREQVLLEDTDTRVQDVVSCESFKPLGVKWAHPISVPETGCVLIASEQLDGVHTFERTVILLLSSGNKDPHEGPFGLIINRPLRKKIKHMKPTNLGLATTFGDCPLHFGGPLEASMFLVKTRENVKLPGFEQVIPGLYFGARNSLEKAARLIEEGVLRPQDFRFFVGYTGWQMDQLREEIESDYWHVAACSTNLIGGSWPDSSSEGLWQETLRLMGGDYTELSRRPKLDN